eukprot:330256-Rhodomonas_salina.1
MRREEDGERRKWRWRSVEEEEEEGEEEEQEEKEARGGREACADQRARGERWGPPRPPLSLLLSRSAADSP